MRLYSYFRSSCSHRVRIALALKGLAYAYVPVHLVRDGGEQHKDAFRALNPMEQVPLLALEDEGRQVRLTQSVAILEYLEERFPTPALLPQDRLARARVRMCVEIANSGVQPLQNLATMNEIKRLGGDGAAFARTANERGLAALEDAAEGSGLALIGETPTLADVCLVPQMASARRFGVDLAAFPKLVAIDAHLSATPPFVAAHPDNQPDAQP